MVFVALLPCSKVFIHIRELELFRGYIANIPTIADVRIPLSWAATAPPFCAVVAVKVSFSQLIH
jgi:hypothetical protein